MAKLKSKNLNLDIFLKVNKTVIKIKDSPGHTDDKVDIYAKLEIFRNINNDELGNLDVRGDKLVR